MGALFAGAEHAYLCWLMDGRSPPCSLFRRETETSTLLSAKQQRNDPEMTRSRCATGISRQTDMKLAIRQRGFGGSGYQVVSGVI